MARGDRFTLEELQQKTGVKPTVSSSTTPQDTPQNDPKPVETVNPKQKVEDISLLQQIGTGAAKGLATTAIGIGSLGRNIQKGVSKGIDAITGAEDFGISGESIFEGEKKVQAQEFLKPNTGAERVGFGAERIAEFLIPSTYATKATVGMGLTARMLSQGVAGGSVQAAQSGKIDEDTAKTAALAAISVPVGDLLSKGITSLSDHFPKWLVQPLVKNSPSEKLKGRDVAKYLVDSGRVGTVDKIISQTDEVMNTLNTQIDDVIKTKTAAGVTINKKGIIDDLINEINRAGGAIDETEVLSTLDSLAPQARGLLSKDVLTLEEANTLRKALDKTLGSRAFVAQQLPFRKGVLMDFTNGLREAVQSSDKTLAPLYKEFTKNISLQQALQARVVAGGGANSIGMYDLLTGGAAFGATGDPITSLLAIGGRRVLESAPAKTGLAQVFKNAKGLERLGPAARSAFLAFVSSLQENNTDIPPGQQTTQEQ